VFANPFFFYFSEFYLILDVAVGATNGWFPDGVGGKPWLDGSLSTSSYGFLVDTLPDDPVSFH